VLEQFVDQNATSLPTAEQGADVNNADQRLPVASEEIKHTTTTNLDNAADLVQSKDEL